MADELGAVRRTARPTGDHQTPETVAQPGAGTTQTGRSVSEDAGNGTDDLRAEVSDIAEALANLRGRMMATAAIGGPDVTDDALEAFAALPECEACGGTGKDDHGTPFEAPLAVHFAGPPVKAEGRRRQLCMWCGHVIADLPSRKGDTLPPPWADGSLVRIEDGEAFATPYTEGDELPPGCCALPDDLGEKQSSEDADQQEYLGETEHCGKHVPGTSSNRCLLRPGHTGDCSDEFELPPCTCGADRCDRLNVNGQCQHCARIGPGQGCPAEPWCDEHGHPALRCSYCDTTGEIDESGPDEAQETRAAADWPAESEDGDTR